MKFLTKALVTSLVMAAGIAYAEVEATDPVVIARQDLMKANGGAVKVLSDMASGATAFDAAAAEAAKAKLISDAAEIPAKFEANPVDAGSGAKPEVWTNWDDFVAKGKALGTAASAMDATSLDGVKAGLGAVGGACKDCHTTYKM